MDEFSVDGFQFHYIENIDLLTPNDCQSQSSLSTTSTTTSTTTTKPANVVDNSNSNGQETNQGGGTQESNEAQDVDHKKTRLIKCVQGRSVAGYWDYQYKLPDQCSREFRI